MSFQQKVPDIAVSQPLITPPVETSTAQAISAVGEIAGEVVLGVQKKGVRDQAKRLESAVGTVNDVIAAHGGDKSKAFSATGGLVTHGLDEDLQRQIDMVKTNAGKEFSLIASAVQQGATPQEAAALQAEATISRLVRQTPGFSKEIKELARELLGYDPSGFAIRRTLQITAPKATPKTQAETRWEQAHMVSQGLAVQGVHVTPENIFGGLAVQDYNAMLKANADAALEVGTYNFDQWYNQSSVRSGVDLSDAMTRIIQVQMQEGIEGGIKNPQAYINAAIESRETEKRRVGTAGAEHGAGRSSIDAAYADIDRRYQPLIDLVSNNSYVELMKTHWDEISTMYKIRGNDALPWLSEILTTFPQIAPEIFNVIANVADPGQLNILYPPGTAIREVIDSYGLANNADRLTRNVTDTLFKLNSGRALSAEETALLPLVESQAVQSRPEVGADPKSPTLRSEYVTALANNGAPTRAASVLGRNVPAITSNDQEKRFFKSQFDIAVGTPATEEIPGNLIAAVAEEVAQFGQPVRLSTETTERTFGRTMMGLGPKTVSHTPRLVVSAEVSSGVRGDIQTPAMKKLQVYLDAVSQNGWGTVFGVDSGTFPATLASRVNNRVAQQAEKAAQDKVFGWTQGANAATSWATGGLRTTGAQGQRDVRGFQNFLQGGPEEGAAGTPAAGIDYTTAERPEGVPVGVFQNNPTNLKRIEKRSWRWDGEVETKDPHAAFSAPEYGFRAGAMNLRIGYHRDGEDTLEKIIKGPPGQPNKGWAEGNQEPYVEFLAKAVGIPRDKTMTEAEFEAILPELLLAMATFENGHNHPFTPDQVTKGLELLGNAGKRERKK